MEKCFFKNGQQDWQEIVPENAGQNVESGGRTFPQIPIGKRTVIVTTTFVVARITLKREKYNSVKDTDM